MQTTFVAFVVLRYNYSLRCSSMAERGPNYKISIIDVLELCPINHLVLLPWIIYDIAGKREKDTWPYVMSKIVVKKYFPDYAELLIF